jgi:hypothetical protein
MKTTTAERLKTARKFRWTCRNWFKVIANARHLYIYTFDVDTRQWVNFERLNTAAVKQLAANGYDEDLSSCSCGNHFQLLGYRNEPLIGMVHGSDGMGKQRIAQRVLNHFGISWETRRRTAA